ncbi:class I SAM-dependent methyltransferase [Paenibacillus cremeus]|uniref:Class I SAM-dependent methyltransferase n=1 Tax=Paenibacillus cremeus TaxID=2163881 RepID=A0A559K927_9BACL|nr:class I SAM-dependent methyltransferase [Paenibacillus cremeus]TVY08635.1 class I SAM-dependent methyltransferase [Paenibacillus cremeus]
MDAAFKRNLVQAYNFDAHRRNQHDKSSWKVDEREQFLKLLLDEEKKSLLEIGAGTGQDSLYFFDRGLDTTSIDISDEMIKACKEKGLNASVMDFYHLDYSDQSFDAVYALNCLLHVPKANISSVLMEIKRVLKPNGLFYMGVYGGRDSEGVWEEDSCEPKRFFSFFSDARLRELVSSIFELVYFNVVPQEKGDLHFQSLILRNSTCE